MAPISENHYSQEKKRISETLMVISNLQGDSKAVSALLINDVLTFNKGLTVILH